MLSIIGSIIGFSSSFLPRLIDFAQDRRDKKHEIEMIRAQTEAQLQLEGERLECASVGADIRESEALLRHDASLQRKTSQWVVDLAGTVRPLITYLFFFSFLALIVCLNAGWMGLDKYDAIWDEEMKAIFAAIISFWFGNRAMRRSQS